MTVKFTAQQAKHIEAFKKRLFREQQAEVMRVRIDAFERGKREGREDTINQMRRWLMLPDITNEDRNR